MKYVLIESEKTLRHFVQLDNLRNKLLVMMYFTKNHSFFNIRTN